MTITLMSPDEAHAFRADHDNYVKALYRMTKGELAVLHRSQLRADGVEIIYGGPVTKDEYARDILARRYPIDKLNEAGHVLFHGHPASWQDCPWCDPHPCPLCGALASCAYEAGGPAVVNGRHIQ